MTSSFLFNSSCLLTSCALCEGHFGHSLTTSTLCGSAGALGCCSSVLEATVGCFESEINSVPLRYVNQDYNSDSENVKIKSFNFNIQNNRTCTWIKLSSNMEALFYRGGESRKSDFPISLKVKSRKMCLYFRFKQS